MGLKASTGVLRLVVVLLNLLPNPRGHKIGRYFICRLWERVPCRFVIEIVSDELLRDCSFLKSCVYLLAGFMMSFWARSVR